MWNSCIKTVRGVVDWRLCLGCGACAYICPERKIRLVDVLNEGIRPLLSDQDCGSCRECLDVCPAYENDHRHLLQRPGILPELVRIFGPVLEVWEGHAGDPEIRRLGASGGLISALAVFCLERQGMHAVLHTGGDPLDPVRNRTRMSRTRQEILSCTGSRYSPASVCDGLRLIESASGQCVFIGQPSEVTALRKSQAIRPGLNRNVGLAISFFCAGSPATRGTLDLLKTKKVAPEEVEELRYRGLGWPGMFAVRRRAEQAFAPLMTYQESWGLLQKHRPFSVHLSPDSSGEDADVSCADPWYRVIREGEEGFSLVVVRTDLGRRILRQAQQAGYVQLQAADPIKVLRSQQELVGKRGALWGRIRALRALGLPAPRLRGFSLLANWVKLPFNSKLRSTFGTVRRAIQRNYFRPLRLQAEAFAELTSPTLDRPAPQLPVDRKP